MPGYYPKGKNINDMHTEQFSVWIKQAEREPSLFSEYSMAQTVNSNHHSGILNGIKHISTYVNLPDTYLNAGFKGCVLPSQQISDIYKPTFVQQLVKYEQET